MQRIANIHLQKQTFESHLDFEVWKLLQASYLHCCPMPEVLIQFTLVICSG